MRTFGLIGYPLSHSFSPNYFADKFEALGITDARYLLFPLEKMSDLSSHVLEQYPHLAGFNVTIPYKESIIEQLDWVHPEAKVLGAVNTVKVFRQDRQIKLWGYNTDVVGFDILLNTLVKSTDTTALIMGTGGSSKAVRFILEKRGISYNMVSRTPGAGQFHYRDLDADVMHRTKLLINCTPVGMHPDVDQLLPLPYKYLNEQMAMIDLIYNPSETAFLKKGKEAGCRVVNGAFMLTAQADAAWDIWNEPK